MSPRRPRAVWALVLASAALAGCADKLPVSPLPVYKPEITLDTRWKTDLGTAKTPLLTPLIQDHVLYLATTGGEIEALDPDSGKERWHLKTGESFSAGIGASGHALLFGNRKGEILAWTLTGQFLWRTQVTSELMDPPQGADGQVVARSADGAITAFDESTGKQHWRVTRQMPPLVLRGVGGITLGHGMAVVGLPGGKLAALSLLDGTTDWETLVSRSRGATELERVNDVLGAPIMGPSDVCTATYQGRAACFDVTKGDVIWSREVDAVGPLVMADNYFIVVNGKSDVQALDRATGAVQWKNLTLEGRYLSPPTVTASYVVLGDAEGIVHWLSREDGHELGRAETAKVPIVEGPLYLGGDRVLVSNREGKSFVLEPVVAH